MANTVVRDSFVIPPEGKVQAPDPISVSSSDEALVQGAPVEKAASAPAIGLPGAGEASANVSSNRRRFRIAFLICAVVVVALAGWLTSRATRTAVLDRTISATTNALGLIEQGISGEVAKFETLAEVIAGDPNVMNFFLTGEGIDIVNQRLTDIRGISGALEVYLIGLDGVTLAASNWAEPVTFIGKNFSFRPYFQEALAGRPGRFFGLGTTSLQRGYFFAAPIRVEGAIAGVSVVKMRIDHLEKIWQLDGRQVVIVDDAGVIFMSTNPDWHYRTIGPLTEDRRRRIEETRQYPLESLSRLPLADIAPISDTLQTVAVALAQGTSPGRALLARRAMQPIGWTIMTFSTLDQVARVTWLAALTGAALAIGLFALIWVAYERRTQALRTTRLHAEHARNLERIVEERTRDLSLANDDLRAMQKIVAVNSKFAAIGKLSGGLCHEISQPLTAIDTQVYNARKALDKGREKAAVESLGRIDALSERLSAIVQKLKSLARGSEIALDAVPLRAAVDEVLQVMAPELGGVILDIEEKAGKPIIVNAEQTLLEQVLVNVIANALDAMRDSEDKSIRFCMEAGDGKAELLVIDNGTGLAPGQETEIFEPFETTKSAKRGLGLGLTIAQDAVTRFGGQISAENNRTGTGATLRIVLPLASTQPADRNNKPDDGNKKNAGEVA